MSHQRTLRANGFRSGSSLQEGPRPCLVWPRTPEALAMSAGRNARQSTRGLHRLTRLALASARAAEMGKIQGVPERTNKRTAQERQPLWPACLCQGEGPRRRGPGATCRRGPGIEDRSSIEKLEDRWSIFVGPRRSGGLLRNQSFQSASPAARELPDLAGPFLSRVSA